MLYFVTFVPDGPNHLTHIFPAQFLFRRFHHDAYQRLRSGFPYQDTPRITESLFHFRNRFLYIRISHDREYKERLVTLDESLLLIRWMSLHSTKPKLREFHVKDFEVRASAWMLIPRA